MSIYCCGLRQGGLDWARAKYPCCDGGTGGYGGGTGGAAHSGVGHGGGHREGVRSAAVTSPLARTRGTLHQAYLGACLMM